MKTEQTTLAKPELGEPYLLTPGPLTTSIEVKRAMLRDWGNAGTRIFRTLTADLRRRLLALLGPGSDAFECVLGAGIRHIRRRSYAWYIPAT